MTSFNFLHEPTKNNTKWLVHNWNTFGARANHGQLGHTRLTTARTLGSHHLPSYNILCSSTRRPHPNGFLSRDSQVGVLNFLRLGLLWLWRHITSCEDLRLQWGLKKSCSPCQELSNGMSHVTWKQENWVDSQLLIVRSQIVNLTPGLSFDHNLCFKCPNGQCKPILDMYASITF